MYTEIFDSIPDGRICRIRMLLVTNLENVAISCLGKAMLVQIKLPITGNRLSFVSTRLQYESQVPKLFPDVFNLKNKKKDQKFKF